MIVMLEDLVRSRIINTNPLLNNPAVISDIDTLLGLKGPGHN